MADFVLSQSVSFLAFFLCGICAAACFDFFRILRRLIPHNTLAIALEDMAFWLITGIFLFLLLFLFQSGRLRFFLPIAFLSGVCLWLISFSRLLMGPICHFFLFLKEKVSLIFRNFHRKPS